MKSGWKTQENARKTNTNEKNLCIVAELEQGILVVVGRGEAAEFGKLVMFARPEGQLACRPQSLGKAA